MGNVVKVDDIEKASNVFIRLLEHFKINWKWWILMTLFAFMVSLMISIVKFINSDDMFERYDAYIEEKHQLSNEYRIGTVPLITAQLNNLSMESGAERVYVAEFHNGKNNPTGLQWQYVDMTFINDKSEDVRDEFQNVPVTKYPLSYELYENGYFIGDAGAIDKIDHRMALRLEVNEVEYVATMMMYGNNGQEIGFIGLSYSHKPEMTRKDIKQLLCKYSLTITPYLDIKNAKKYHK